VLEGVALLEKGSMIEDVKKGHLIGLAVDVLDLAQVLVGPYQFHRHTD